MTDQIPSLRDTIERYDLAAKKSLGQHFLLDLNLTRKIARAADITAEDRVLEIGPGPGGLTRALLETGAAVTAVERDTRCINALEELAKFFPNELNIVEADALSIDEFQLADRPVKIVANLPYNISTELLLKWLKAPALWSIMTLMFQREVADRILARPGNKTYGRLSVISQIASAPARAFDLPARAFTPPPKVDSTVVRFDPAPAKFDDISSLEQVTQAAFSQRRKMIRSSLKSIFGERLDDALHAAGVSATLRAENLSVEHYKVLAKYHAVNAS